MTNPDRLYIDIRARNTIEKMESTNFLNSANIKNREIILYAISRGIESPSIIEGKKDGYINEKDLSINDEALIYACVLPILDDIEKISDKGFIYDYVQQAANTGFKIIENEIEHHSIETMDKTLLVELDEQYKKLGI
jgi:hypothetical protein